MILTTRRLRLIPATAEQIRALIRSDYATASTLIGAIVPHGWPDDTETRDGLPWHLKAIEEDSRQSLWRIRFVIEQEPNALIGAINLKGLPSGSGDIEIGWGIVAGKRRRGFATEASRAVIEWAFASGRVTRVSATIPEENVASQCVAQRLGMSKSAETRRGLPVWTLRH